MERLLVIFLALFSLTAHAVGPSGVPSITLGVTPASQYGQAVVDLYAPSATTGAVFSVYYGANSVTSTGVYPLYKNGVPWQIPSGKAGVCFAQTINAGTFGGNGQFQLMSNGAAITPGMTSGFTTPAWQGGATTSWVNILGPTSNSAAPVGGLFSFGANTYAGIQFGTATAYYYNATCYEK